MGFRRMIRSVVVNALTRGRDSVGRDVFLALIERA
jgi:hypothetical protein